MKIFNNLNRLCIKICIITSIFIVLSVLILVMNINDNKGVLPLIFGLCLVYMIFYCIGYYFNENLYNFKKDNGIKLIFAIDILLLLISLLLLILSAFVFW